MILLIMGTTHTGKTLLAQRLLERYHFPYLSIDHLKMGLIRSHNSALTPESSDEALTAELWPIVREMIKTNIENHQNLIVEGCYIPFSWRDDFEEEYRREIRDFCIIFSRKYIEKHFSDILAFENVVENRMPPDFSQTAEEYAEENRRNLEYCRKCGVNYHMIEDTYDISLEQVLCGGEKKKDGLRLLCASETEGLLPCLRELADYHNQVSIHFSGWYPREPFEQSLEKMERALKEGTSQIAVVEEKGTVVGFCKIDFHEKRSAPTGMPVQKTGTLAYLVVCSAYRKRGYGRMLMDWAMQVFQRKGITGVEVKVLEGNPAIHLYEKYGFQMNSHILWKMPDSGGAGQ